VSWGIGGDVRFDGYCAVTIDHGLELFLLFDDIDLDRSGKVSQKEWCEVFQLQQSPLVERVFHLHKLQESPKQELSFHQFLIGLWDLCTRDMPLIARWAFDALDVDKSGGLDEDELRALGKLLNGGCWAGRAMERVVRKCQQSGGTLLLPQFVSLCNEQPVLLSPVRRIQRMLQNRVFGRAFWRIQTRYRASKYGDEDNMSNIVQRGFFDRERELDSMMRAEFLAAEELEATVIHEVEDELLRTETERWASMGPCQRAEELAMLSVSALRGRAVFSLMRSRSRGLLSGEDLLEKGTAHCHQIRCVEIQLDEWQRLVPLSIREQETRAADELEQRGRAEAEKRIREIPEFRDKAAREAARIAKAFRAMVRHGGTGHSVLPSECFLPDPNWKPSYGEAVADALLLSDPVHRAASRHTLALLGRSLHEELMQTTRADLRLQTRTKMEEIHRLRTSLLQEFGIDDGHVNYTQWARRFHPVLRRYYWESRAARYPPLEEEISSGALLREADGSIKDLGMLVQEMVDRGVEFLPPVDLTDDWEVAETPGSTVRQEDDVYTPEEEPSKTSSLATMKATDGFLADESFAPIADAAPSAPRMQDQLDILSGLQPVPSQPTMTYQQGRPELAAIRAKRGESPGVETPERVRKRREQQGLTYKNPSPEPDTRVALVGAVKPEQRAFHALLEGQYSDKQVAPSLFANKYRSLFSEPTATKDAGSVLDAVGYEGKVQFDHLRFE
jgi:Ca2+-binding EF-hand superfamily protein